MWGIFDLNRRHSLLPCLKKLRQKNMPQAQIKQDMKDKKIVITVEEDGELAIELVRISNHFELLGILLTAADNVKYWIQEEQK